jgi:hypothetical protein
MSPSAIRELIIGQPVMHNTAATFQRLAQLRGVIATIEWDEGAQVYRANGVSCSTSVHGLYDWLNRQPGVRP